MSRWFTGCAVALVAAYGADTQAVSAIDGSASFSVRTNAFGLDVTGKSSALRVDAELRPTPNGVAVERVAAWFPVSSLTTAMSLRDDHMRRLVFTKTNGEAPDVRFEAEKLSCSGLVPGKEVTCPVTGTLAIQGTPRKFSTTLKIKQESATMFRVRGDATVKLSDYGIEQPSQLGVKTTDEVQVHLEFTAKSGVSVAAR